MNKPVPEGKFAAMPAPFCVTSRMENRVHVTAMPTTTEHWCGLIR